VRVGGLPIGDPPLTGAVPLAAPMHRGTSTCVCILLAPLQLYNSLDLKAPTTVPGISKAQLIEDVAAALYASKICSYAQVRAHPEHVGRV